MEVPTAFREQACTIGKSAEDVTIRCDDAALADEVVEFLANIADIGAILKQCREIASYVNAGNEVIPSLGVRRLAGLMNGEKKARWEERFDPDGDQADEEWDLS